MEMQFHENRDTWTTGILGKIISFQTQTVKKNEANEGENGRLAYM